MKLEPVYTAIGDRCLNVAVSRAREEMVIFTSLKPSQLDTEKTGSKGIELLKDFIEFAETGRLPSSAGVESPFKDGLARRSLTGWRKLALGRDSLSDVLRQRSTLLYWIPQIRENISFVFYLTGSSMPLQTRVPWNLLKEELLCSLSWDVLWLWVEDFHDDPDYVIEMTAKRLRAVCRLAV